MTDIVTSISQFIEEQFPSIYREEGEVIVAFIKAYYEFLETNGYLINREMFDIRDIDNTYDSFLAEFQKKYLEDFPFVSATDTRYLVKNIMDLYRAKGSDESIKLLMRLLYNEDVEIYYPSQDVLRVSDSLWVDPKYVEVFSSERSLTFVNKSVFGSVSGATAFVDAVVTKRSNNRLIDILYLSDVQGTFVFGDIISDDGVLENAPRVIGSLTEIEINSTSTDTGGNKLGDQFDVISSFGKNGKAVVSEIVNATNEVRFQLLDGGYGYTLDDNTRILVSDLMVVRDNANTVFETGEIVQQRIEKVTFQPASSQPFFNSLEIGETISGAFDANTTPVSGLIVNKDADIINNVAYPYVNLQVDANTTFMRSQNVTFAEEAFFEIGEELEEQSTYTFNFTTVPAYEIGERVYQRVFLEGSSNTISSTYNYGTVDSVSNSAVVVTEAFGEFSANLDLIGVNSSASGTIETIETVNEGAVAIVSEKISNTEYVVTSSELLQANNKVISSKTGAEALIDTETNLSVSKLVYDTLEEADFETNTAYFKGVVVDQDDETIKITTVENQFEYLSGSSILFGANGGVITVEQIDAGVGASFKIGELTNTETVSLSTEKISDLNIKGITFENIVLDGKNSGVGYVESITVNDGGTGYTNSSVVTFLGGGFEGQNPLIPASGSVVTDDSGVIVQIQLSEIGEGYYENPSISVSDGSGANLSVEMTFGYGFPADFFSGYDTVVDDALLETTFEIGTISKLTENKSGDLYSRPPSVIIENQVISKYDKQDQTLQVNIIDGEFTLGEIVTQANSAAKGIVLSRTDTVMVLRNISFAEDFVTNKVITGSVSDATASVTSVVYNNGVPMGLNASIDNSINTKDGVVTKMRVIDSGYGYQDGELISLLNDNNTLQGTASILNQGFAPGYWKSTNSHLNSEKRIHDNRYYQDFSYDIKSPINIEDYREIVLDILHVAGSQFFGSVLKTTVGDPQISSESTIQQS